MFGPDWMRNYLEHRLKTPFIDLEHALSVGTDPEVRRLNLAEALYQAARANGVLYGCPVPDSSPLADWKSLGLPEGRGAILMTYIDTMYRACIRQIQAFEPARADHESSLLWSTLRILSFFLPDYDVNSVAPDATLAALLKKDKSFLKSLTKLAKYLDTHLRVQSSMFSRADTLQNGFAFLDILFLQYGNHSMLIGEKLDDFAKEQLRAKENGIKEDLMMIFAALIWADDRVAAEEAKVMSRLLKSSSLPSDAVKRIKTRFKTPVRLEDLDLRLRDPLIQRFTIESLILLSLIDAQEADEEADLIRILARKLKIGDENLDLLYCSVGNFFQLHGAKFAFLKSNPASLEVAARVQEKIMTAVKLNSDRIMNEVRETGELYTLMVKATKEPLTEEEKDKVKEQLLDIAKTVPAIAIFALPAGGILLPMLIKVLPFNILPSSFQDEPEPAGAAK